MRIQPSLNNKKDVNFKAVYAADPSYSGKLGAMLKSAGTGTPSKDLLFRFGVWGGWCGRNNKEEYDSILFMKGVTLSNLEAISDVFYNKKEAKIVSGLVDKILVTKKGPSEEKLVVLRNKLFEVVKGFAESAKPISTERIMNSYNRTESFLNQVRKNTATGLLRG